MQASPSEAAKPSTGTESDPVNARIVLEKIAADLARELHPERRGLRLVDLDSSLDRDWGFDSLSRAELLLRIERAFAVRLPERLLGEAGTLKDILTALEAETTVPHYFSAATRSIIAEDSAKPAPAEATTLTEVLDWHVQRHGQRTHIVLWHGDGRESSFTYVELANQARAVASGLRETGLKPGERVAIMLPTGIDFFVAFFGILYAGGVPTPIYPPTRPSQIEEHIKRQALILRNASAVFLISAQDSLALARLLKLQVESLRAVYGIAELGQGTMALPVITPQSAALVQYTSGSTGDPKGVVLSHSNLLANIRAMGQAMEANSSDVFVSWLPLYHDMGLVGAWLGSLYFAAPLVVMSPITFLVRPEQWLWAIHQHRATLSAAPNFAFELCATKIEDHAIVGLDLSSLRVVANGSEAVSPATIRRFTDRFAKYGFRKEAMAPAYGLAENVVGLTLPPLGQAPIVDRVDRNELAKHGRAVPARPGDPTAVEFVSCGRSLPNHQIRIIDAAGEVGERREGRLQFRGASATCGYLDNPAKTAALFDGDWLNSGDLAYIAGGDIFITGRSKDIIIRAGRHIYPEEIEAAVGDVPGIRKGCVAVFGAQDSHTGTERVIVVAETDEIDAVAFIDLRHQVEQAAARLLDAPPDEVVIGPPHTVPKTASGKLRRAAARDLFERGNLVREPQPKWRQLLALAIAGGQPQLRRVVQWGKESLYGVWWWAIIGIMGIALWPMIILLPHATLRHSALRRMARLAFRLTGIRLEVTGTWPQKESAIIVVNHASYIDGLVLAATLPGEFSFVVKKELESQFFAGVFLRALGALFVDRRDPEGGVEDTSRALAAAQAGRTLVFFPEGTLTRAPGLLPFRLGAFIIATRQNIRVLPLALRGTRSVLRGEQWLPRHGPIAIHIGSPILPDGTDFAGAVRLRDKTRTEILAHCGEPDIIEP